LIINKPQLII
jgi:hypothetical protein